VNFREATEEDYRRIAEMHERQGLGYLLPPLHDRSIVTKLVAEKENRIVFAALLRLTSEAYLIGSPEGTPAERWEILKTGNYHLLNAAWRDGFSDLHCWIPPKVRAFGKRLSDLGWRREDWPSYNIWPGAVLGKNQ